MAPDEEYAVMIGFHSTPDGGVEPSHRERERRDW